MNDENNKQDPNRRRFLKGAGLAVGAAALGSGAGKLQASETCTVDQGPWDFVTDVICVGSGAAACSTAITAKSLCRGDSGGKNAAAGWYHR